MLNLPRRTSMALVGWLWADLLLGLFVLFLAANSAGTPVRRHRHYFSWRPFAFGPKGIFDRGDTG